MRDLGAQRGAPWRWRCPAQAPRWGFHRVGASAGSATARGGAAHAGAHAREEERTIADRALWTKSALDGMTRSRRRDEHERMKFSISSTSSPRTRRGARIVLATMAARGPRLPVRRPATADAQRAGRVGEPRRACRAPARGRAGADLDVDSRRKGAEHAARRSSHGARSQERDVPASPSEDDRTAPDARARPRPPGGGDVGAHGEPRRRMPPLKSDSPAICASSSCGAGRRAGPRARPTGSVGGSQRARTQRLSSRLEARARTSGRGPRTVGQAAHAAGEASEPAREQGAAQAWP